MNDHARQAAAFLNATPADNLDTAQIHALLAVDAHLGTITHYLGKANARAELARLQEIETEPATATPSAIVRAGIALDTYRSDMRHQAAVYLLVGLAIGLAVGVFAVVALR
jgi:hypothetical protein